MQTLFLTGSTGWIGKAILEKFQSKNYTVIAPNRDELDLSCKDSIQNYLFQMNLEIDIFIHCAGINHPAKFSDLTSENFFKTFTINTASFYQLCHHFITHNLVKKNGSLLAISSIYGEFSRKGRFAYTTSKHALNGMIKTLALELGEHNIKVNALSPGFVDTQMTRKNNNAEVIEQLKNKIPLQRLATPNDIAEIAYFLCSNNNYITGQCIIADGGYSAGGFEN